ncbi:MAG: isoprenylcysteine carboxylmethyltransferase family protein [Ancalomicrobiaceae bacterium]|nr:isoprenylcysteine carboxylmethyltransferase family protein [Ancalomicrobiaceae bacterium]
MLLTRLYPPHVFLLAVIAMALLHWLLPVVILIAGPWRFLAVVPLVASGALAMPAIRAFRAANTTTRPFEHSEALVTSGVYRLTRNPMYLGLLFFLAGIAVALGSLTPWLGVIGFFVAIDRLFIAYEEPMLAIRFGADYEAYKQKVRRWI